MAAVHRFRLHSSFGPADVFRLLREVAGGETGLDSEFDWLRRRVALLAGSREELDAGVARLREAWVAAGGPAGGLLAGPVAKEGERWTAPFGVLVHGPAEFAELIAATLLEVGVVGTRCGLDGETVEVPLNAVSRRIDFRGLIMEFPLPDGMRVSDEGIAP